MVAREINNTNDIAISGSSPLRTALLCWVGWVLDFFDLILITFLIPSIEHDLGIETAYGSWLIGIGLGASGVGGILFGWFADIYGRRLLLRYTVVLFSLGMILTGLSQNPEQFIIFRFITGLGLGGEWAVGHALVAESVPADKRGRWSAFLQSGEPVGVALAAFVGFIIAPIIGWRLAFIFSGCIGGVIWLVRKRLPESEHWLNQPKISTSERLQAIRVFLGQHYYLMILAFILAVFKLGTYWTCYTWLPRFIGETFGSNLGKSFVWFFCGQLGQFIGMQCFGIISDKLGRRIAFTLFSTITASALLPLALFWHELFKHHTVIFWSLMFVMGFGAGCTAGFGALLSELFPTRQRTFAMGTVYNTARGVMLFAPVLVGAMVSWKGILGGLMVPTTLAILTALWVWTLPEKKGQALN